MENFLIGVILFLFRNVLKILPRGPKVFEKKCWVVLEKTAKNIDFVDFEMTERPSIQAVGDARYPGQCINMAGIWARLAKPLCLNT